MADNRIAYGIAKGMGINTDGMKPREVWQAIANKHGVSVEQAIHHAYANHIRAMFNSKIKLASKELRNRLNINSDAKRKIIEYVKKFRNGESVEKEIDLMEVSPRTKKDLGELLGEEITAKTHSLHIDELRHMEKRHGVNGTANRDLAKIEDYEKIIDVLNGYEGKPEFSRDVKGNVEYSYKYKDKYGNYAPKVELKKEIDDKEYVVIVAISNNKSRRARTITSYKNKSR